MMFWVCSFGKQALPALIRLRTLSGISMAKGKTYKPRIPSPSAKPRKPKLPEPIPTVTGEIVSLARGQGRNNHGLTSKQDAFARHVAAGDTLASAYRAAYDADGMSPAAVHVAASKLMDHPAVALRVNGLIAEKEVKTSHDASRMRRFVIERLHIEANDPNNPPSVRVRALELIGKVDVVGMFRDRVEAVAEAPAASDLAATLEARLRALLPSPDKAGS